MTEFAGQGAGIRHATRGLSARALDDPTEHAIHERTLDILEGVGVTLGSAPLRDRLADAGALVDGDRVCLPASMVEAALAVEQPTLLFAGRAPDSDLRLDGSRAWLSVDGCAAEVLDPGTDDTRPSTLADVEMLTRLADALPEIGFVWQPVAARDVPVAVKALHELHVQLRATRKHITMMTAVTPLAAEGVVEIGRLVAGGDAALRARPILSSFQCSLSPLVYEGEAMEAAVIMAEAGIPSGFVVMPISCATAPATPFGTLLVANAEVVAGVVILRTLVPDARTFYGACPTVMDLYTGAAACGGPEDVLFQMASCQLARRYRLPSMVGTFATGSRCSDWQAGLENGISGLASLMAGADLLTGAGLLRSALVCSPEQMVLDAEAFGLLAALTAPDALAIDPAARDLIADVGPQGHFLDRDHTLEHLTGIWQPQLFHREDEASWQSAGRPGPRERARQRVEALLASATGNWLPPAAEDDIARLIGEMRKRSEAPGG